MHTRAPVLPQIPEPALLLPSSQLKVSWVGAGSWEVEASWSLKPTHARGLTPSPWLVMMVLCHGLAGDFRQDTCSYTSGLSFPILSKEKSDQITDGGFYTWIPLRIRGKRWLLSQDSAGTSHLLAKVSGSS